MQIQSVGIIGYGAFGAFLADLLSRVAPSIEVRVHSARFPADGKVFFTLEDTCAADALILCVPIRAFGETLRNALPHLGERTVVIDVSTVKTYTVGLLKEVLGDRPYLASHPMFGPESYKKRAGDIRGMRIVVTDYSSPAEDAQALMTALRGIGFDVVEMTSEQHDRHLAETLFLTHYVGQIVHAAGFERTEIDTVSFGFLMDAVDSVRHDGELFADVYRYNPYCKETIERFEKAQREVENLLDSAG